jgi:hypothetical protein
MVGYVVGRFGLFQMERLQGNLLICAAWPESGTLHGHIHSFDQAFVTDSSGMWYTQ